MGAGQQRGRLHSGPPRRRRQALASLALSTLAVALLAQHAHLAQALVAPQRTSTGAAGAGASAATAARAAAGGRAGAGGRGPRIHADHTLSLPNWCSAGPYAEEDVPLYTAMTRTGPAYKLYHNTFWHAHKWYALVPPAAMLKPGEAAGADGAPAPAPTGADADAAAEGAAAAEGGSAAESAVAGSAAAAAAAASNATQLNAEQYGLEEGLSVNCALIRLPIANATAFTDGMRAGFLPGTTLLVDFPFPAFPDNLGHWLEIMTPTFSVLANGSWRADARGSRGRFVDRILLPNLRKEMNDWFKEVLALAVAPGVRRGGAPVPPIIDHTDLDAFPKLSWLAFENLLVIQDRYTHPERKTGFIGADHGDLWRYDGCARYVDRGWDVGFAQPEHAAEFRAAAYKRAGLPVPAAWAPGSPPPALSPGFAAPGSPPLLTLLMAHEDYPALVNWREVQSLLRRLAPAHGLVERTVTLSTDAPFASHLDTFARSAVVVGRHGPLLATSALLAPGAAVFELLPYKWEWLGISKLYYNITRTVGDIHHFAWRPTEHTLAHYDHENYTRYAPWTPEECSARECLMVHARAGLTADITELEALLSAKLPGVVAGAPIEQLQAPWPKAV
ncbi:hypothetical protein HXX76_010852 [Chlamydomonas incerta]|uniref:Glycosyltransferase n=1 Tax=Chlamydomonas incerta TaxID=51695 RepID=A0A835T073_CHLIN|nr:hypothetical protein HXX76_010852 [Chlamydomonas incerta]|eukprot:KAG2429620.1 hypothetical protein HXX76_010852 [Chlamydomonas incerta]